MLRKIEESLLKAKMASGRGGSERSRRREEGKAPKGRGVILKMPGRLREIEEARGGKGSERSRSHFEDARAAPRDRGDARRERLRKVEESF
jgi:hypothetical protein